MKIFTKRTLILLTLTAAFAAQPAIFADEAASDNADTHEVTTNIRKNTEQIPDSVIFSSYISFDVTVISKSDGEISTALDGTDAENSDNIINYTVSEETVVLDCVNGDKKTVDDIKDGDSLTVFTDAYSPAPLILPPMYSASVIITHDDSESSGMINIDTYLKDDEYLVNASNTLALTVGEETEIVDLDGNNVETADLENKDLAVFYTSSTRSIPAQTTPVKIVVLGENEKALDEIKALSSQSTPEPETSDDTEAANQYVSSALLADTEWRAANTYVNTDSITMVPLRLLAEVDGMTVEWDSENRAVILNGGMYSLKIGENSYVKGKMTPITLSAAPEIKDDYTYVPEEYFTEITD